jgi:hypothetical protein
VKKFWCGCNGHSSFMLIWKRFWCGTCLKWLVIWRCYPILWPSSTLGRDFAVVVSSKGALSWFRRDFDTVGYSGVVQVSS